MGKWQVLPTVYFPFRANSGETIDIWKAGSDFIPWLAHKQHPISGARTAIIYEVENRRLESQG